MALINPNQTATGLRVLLQLSTLALGPVFVLALLIIVRNQMESSKYPKDMPHNLRPEYDKYLQDPKKYQRMYPVCYKLLLKYMERDNGKKEDQ